MPPVDKASWLALLEEQVESHLQDAVRHFQNLDERTLSQPSPTGGWSIAQCLDHLNSYGHYYLPYLQEGLERALKSHSSNTYIGSWLGSYLIRLMDPGRSRTKFKAIKQHQPTELINPYVVVATFIDQQERMLGLLKLAQQADVNKIRIPLSITVYVRLPLGDILQFMVVHTKRHLIQAKRNM